MSSTNATMDIVVNEGRDRKVYPGASTVVVSKSLPEYHGGVTMTIRVSQMGSEPSTITTPRITIDPNIRGGVPCVGLGRQPISHILQMLGSGISPESITQEYSDLTLADIQLALDVAAWVMRDPSIDWLALNLLGMVDFQNEMQAWQTLSDDMLGNSENMPED